MLLLLPGREDADIWRYFDTVGFPAETHLRRVLDVLAETDRPLSTPALEARVELSRTRLELMLKVLDVDGAVRRVSGGWISTGAPWQYDSDRYTRVAQARRAEQQAMRSYISGPGCRMEYLRRTLDDAEAAPCGRCDVCAGPFFPVDVPPTAVVAARSALDRPGVELEPRMQWPSAMEALGVAVRGRIPVDERAAAGRALARSSDLGWGDRLRGLLGPGASDQEIPDAVVAAVVDVLRSWDWESRPAAVVAVPSRRRPTLVSSLATQIAQIGRLPMLDALRLAPGGATTARGGNSAYRLAAVWDALSAPPAARRHEAARSQAGAPGRRLRRLTLDAHRGSTSTAKGRCIGRPSVCARNRRVTSPGMRPRVLLDGLAMPESPRWRDGRLWFSHWGAEEIVAVDLDGNSEVVGRGPEGAG